MTFLLRNSLNYLKQFSHIAWELNILFLFLTIELVFIIFRECLVSKLNLNFLHPIKSCFTLCMSVLYPLLVELGLSMVEVGQKSTEVWLNTKK